MRYSFCSLHALPRRVIKISYDFFSVAICMHALKYHIIHKGVLEAKKGGRTKCLEIRAADRSRAIDNELSSSIGGAVLIVVVVYSSSTEPHGAAVA